MQIPSFARSLEVNFVQRSSVRRTCGRSSELGVQHEGVVLAAAPVVDLCHAACGPLIGADSTCTFAEQEKAFERLGHAYQREALRRESCRPGPLPGPPARFATPDWRLAKFRIVPRR